MLNYLKEQADTGKKIVIFGAGYIGKKVIDILREHEVGIACLCDNDKDKDGQKVEGYEIISPEKLRECDPQDTVVVAASNFFKEMSAQLGEMGFSNVVLFKDLFLKKNDTYDRLIFPKADQPKVSIILTTHNGWKYTYECLKSLLACKTNIAYELIVGDNVSQDETRNMEAYIENVKVIHNPTDIGYLRNCNETAKQARGEYLILLSNDVRIVTDYWLDFLVEDFEHDATVGNIGGACYGWDIGGLSYGCFMTEVGELRGNDTYQEGVFDIDYNCAACMAVRRSLWEEIGGYDERYIPAWFEDLDLYCEVKKRGYRVVLDARFRFVHYENVTYGVVPGADRVYLRNKEKFIKKWKQAVPD